MAGRVLALLGGLAFIIAIVFINTGYIYKTTCPTPTGGSESSWSWTIDDIVPYTRSAPAPCSTHAVGRLALSWTGIWSLGHTVKPVTITAADKQAAVVLGAATKATSDEYARETTASAAITQELKAKGVTQAVEAKLVGLIKGGITKWDAIKSRVEQPTSADDKQLLEARKLLGTYVGYLAAQGQLLLQGTSAQDANAQYHAKALATGQRLEYDLPFLKARYPQVTTWTNLPST